MLQTLYRASFFLYEISFLMLALAVGTEGEIMRRLARTLRLPPFWILPACSAVLLLGCALLHFYVYHLLLPQYLVSGSRTELLLMYQLKTVSMGSILLAGAALALGCGWYLKRTTR
jgi:hypothetical protein